MGILRTSHSRSSEKFGLLSGKRQVIGLLGLLEGVVHLSERLHPLDVGRGHPR